MIDKELIKEAVKMYLIGIGEDPNREGLLDTPDRVARMCEEIYGGYDMDQSQILQKRFKADSQDMVLVKDIDFFSHCEHHLVPFFGKVHIAYIPNSDGEVVGLSKLARLVEMYSRRAQIQEVLTKQIAEALIQEIKPNGVAVIVEAEHMCMTMRGIKKKGSKTITSSMNGLFSLNPEAKHELLQLLKI